MNTVDGVIVLAGGTGARLGGVSKPDYRVAGRRLIDIFLDNARRYTDMIVVIGPDNLSVPGCILTNEDPPLGGPLAGIAAGIAQLSALSDDALIGLGTCDAPLVPTLYPRLNPGDSDGVVPVNEQGWKQYLHGCYRLGALRRISMERDGSIRKAFANLTLDTIDDVNHDCIDVDTPEDGILLATRLTETAESAQSKDTDFS